jgi:hypothetical protein
MANNSENCGPVGNDVRDLIVVGILALLGAGLLATR